MVLSAARGVKASSSAAFASNWATRVAALATVPSPNYTEIDVNTADYRNVLTSGCAQNVS